MPARLTKSTYLEQLDEIPPYLTLALARQKRQPMTLDQVANATGWSMSKVAKLGGLKSWATVSVEDADKFRIACGVDRKSERRHRWYTRRSLGKSINSFNHLRKRGRLPKFIRELTQNKV